MVAQKHLRDVRAEAAKLKLADNRFRAAIVAAAASGESTCRTSGSNRSSAKNSANSKNGVPSFLGGTCATVGVT